MPSEPPRDALQGLIAAVKAFRDSQGSDCHDPAWVQYPRSMKDELLDRTEQLEAALNGEARQDPKS